MLKSIGTDQLSVIIPINQVNRHHRSIDQVVYLLVKPIDIDRRSGILQSIGIIELQVSVCSNP